FQLAGLAFMLMGLADLLAYSGDVHDNSRDKALQTEDTKLACLRECLRRICYNRKTRLHKQLYQCAIIVPRAVEHGVYRRSGGIMKFISWPSLRAIGRCLYSG